MALSSQPRILREFALASGISQWMDINRGKAIKGPKPADAFCKGLAKLRSSLAGSGISFKEIDQAIGHALACRCSATIDKAYADAKSNGALARIDLSFLDPLAVEEGANQLHSDPVEIRGPYEIALLLSTGILPSQIKDIGKFLTGAAAQLFLQAEEKEQAFALRDQLASELPDKKPLKTSRLKTTL